MEFSEVIRNRYSSRKFKDTPVEPEKIEAILEAGRLAPTAKNNQPHFIYIMKSEEALAVVDSVTPCRYGAPIVMVLVYNRDKMFIYPGGKYDGGSEDVSIVATHMMLAAEDQGLGTCWLNAFDPDKLHEAMKLPENETIVMMLDVGYSDAEPAPIHFERNDLKDICKEL